MVIILEGPDGAGKTTLAKNLHEYFEGSTYVHFDQNSTSDQFQRAIELGYPKDSISIMDRCWISEEIYANAIPSRSPKFSVDIMETLEDQADRAGVLYIYCIPPFMTCARTFEKRSDQEYLDNVGLLEDVHTRYTEYWRRLTETEKKNALLFATISDNNTHTAIKIINARRH